MPKNGLWAVGLTMPSGVRRSKQSRGGRAGAFYLCGRQTGLRRLVSELRVPLPDGAVRGKKQTMGRGADYAVWRASQDAADHGEELRLQMAEQTSSDVSWVQTKSAGCRNLLDSPG